jgi:hypothetical protein
LKIKFLSFIFLFISVTVFAQPQDSVYKVIEQADTVYSQEHIDKVTYKPLQQNPVYNKRSFKEGYKSKYTSTDFNYNDQPKTKSLWARFMEWLSRTLGGGKKDNKTSGLSIAWYIVCVLIILVVAYLIAWIIMGKEARWIFGRGRRNITVYDADMENIHETDFATLIEQTQKDGNYRLAVRYYYLWLLKKLSLNEVIIWHNDKTNNDYYYEIKDPALREDFKYLSYVYDHSWYGEFQLSNSGYLQAEKAFKQTLNKL